MPDKVDVAIIVPCYNGEAYLERFLDSVLKQTVAGFQLIFVNDGSTDGTELIINKYKKALDNICEFVYLKKDNGGAASAVNTALKYVNRKYLMWADCDDELTENNILYKYEFLENNIDFDYVVCSARYVDNESLKQTNVASYNDSEKNPNLFENLIFGGIKCYPGVFMIKTKQLFDRLGEKKEIYFDREVGQNWQLLLPIAYEGKCGYIDDVLYNYYVRSNSHSHNTNYAKEIERTYKQEQVLCNTLKFLSDVEYTDYKLRIQSHYQRRRLELAFEVGDRAGFIEEYKQYKKEVNDKEVMLKKEYLILRFNHLYKAYSYFKRLIIK